MAIQAIPAFLINLDRRADRLARVTAHLDARGVAFNRLPACDATTAPAPEIDAIIGSDGPLGPLGLGDRACTVSHTRAWAAFLATGASHALFLEDDITVSADIAEALARTDWIPDGTQAVKLEKFNEGTSTILLGTPVGATPGGRLLHPMRSRHVGGGAYMLSRQGAELALSGVGQIRVPIDHYLFNDTVSPIHRPLAPAMIVPAMATQRAEPYSSDIAPHWRAERLNRRQTARKKLLRGLSEINQAPRQAWDLLSGRARLIKVAYAETPPGPAR